MQLLPAADRQAAPWKNGGGLTREVAVWPPGAGFDDFDWRVSMAEIHANGPFSAFPGVDRFLAVTAGSGLRLSIRGEPPLRLDTNTPPIHFTGDAPCEAALLAGPVSDLNVMVRRGRFDARVRRTDINGFASVITEVEQTLVVALGPLTLGNGECLDRNDAVLLRRGEALRVQAEAARILIVELERLAGARGV